MSTLFSFSIILGYIFYWKQQINVKQKCKYYKCKHENIYMIIHINDRLLLLVEDYVIQRKNIKFIYSII